MSKGIQNKADFYILRYSNCWEDADLLCEALAPVAKGGRLLSIASAGDNTLALLTLDPAQVVASDLSPAQLACLDLKMRAIAHLDTFEVLAFLGVKESGDRWLVYEKLRSNLTEESRVYWDKRKHLIAGGIIHAGRLEAFYARWRSRLHLLAHSERQVKKMLEPDSAFGQRNFFDTQWNTWRWRALYRWMHGQSQMKKGRDAAFYEQAGSDVVSGPLDRLHSLLRDGKIVGNPYLAFEMAGNYRSDALPVYLRPENMAIIRQRLDRVVLRRGPIEEIADGPYDGMNLSDIFEYMPDAFFGKVYRTLLSQLRPGGRLAYWNLHVVRAGSVVMPQLAQALEDELKKIDRRDQVPAYRAFRLEARVDSDASL